jgi:phosphate transport system permease protein
MSTIPAPPPGAVPLTRTLARQGSRRGRIDVIMRTLSGAAAIACVVPLAAVLFYVILNGIGAISVNFFTKSTGAVGEVGGALGAILGSIQMVTLATIMAIPVGVLAGVFVTEFAGRRSAGTISFAADVMVGIPSILIGVFVFTILVLPFKQYNAFAGSVALAIIMIPVIMRTTQEILALVPNTLREASLALGIPRWRTVSSVVLRTGLAGILTGVMLAIARAAGETAPLLFTALGSRLVNVGDFSKPMDALPLFIYNNATQPYPELNQQAWGAAFILLLFVLTVNILVRWRTIGRRTS